MTDITGARETAFRVARWLVDRDRSEEAVLLLSAWASRGPSDERGHQLLAEAFRINPASPEAKLAFERMEGLVGDYQALERALSTYDEGKLSELEAEVLRPTFRRAQVGFNTNISFKNRKFHLQTEDSGLDAPHVITHLFVDGAVIKSRKRSYAEHASRADVSDFVKQLMRDQHLEMAISLREGVFDAILEGQARGGMEVLTEPPNVDLSKFKKNRTIAEVPKTPPPPPPQASARKRLFQLRVVRSLHGGPDVYDVTSAVTVLGVKGAITLDGEPFCRDFEAVFTWRDGALFIEDLEGGNGVFLRIRAPVEIEFGDEFIVGDQLLRLERNPTPNCEPGAGPTYFFSSPQWPSSFRVVQLFEGGAIGACGLARDNSLQVGTRDGELLLPHDALVSPHHCVIDEQAGTLMLRDLGSRTGTFLRIAGEQPLVQGDELLVGRTRLLVTLDEN